MELLRVLVITFLICVIAVLIAPDAAIFVVGACLLATLATPVAVVWMLSKEFRLAPELAEPDELSGELQRGGEELAALGFDEPGPAIRIGRLAKMLLLTRVNRAARLYADAHQQVRKPVFFEFVSIVGEEQHGLSTNNNPDAAFAPAAPGMLRQVLPGLSAPELLERHRSALRFLRTRGIEPAAAEPDAIFHAIRRSFSAYGDLFRRGRLRFALIALSRTILRRSPYMAPLEQQPEIEDQIAEIQNRLGRGL